MTKKPDWRAWRSFAVTLPDQTAFTLTLRGRDRWALEALMRAGAKGCTPIDHPAPRWSAYVFNLRQMGVPIRTHHEAHSGPFPGWHGRYVLECRVEPLPNAVPAT